MMFLFRPASHHWRVLVALVAALALPVSLAGAQAQPASTGTYRNPLKPQIAGDGIVESCADPTVIYTQQPEGNYWYMYCTKDPLNDNDRNENGDFIFHNIPIMRSLDLVHWTYVGDVFPAVPAWGEPTAGLFAPEIDFFNGQYYLYYTMTNTRDDVSGAPGCNDDSAIGVATSSSPKGPWTDLGRPVVEPRYNGDPALPFGSRQCNFFWTIDPEVIEAQGGQNYIYYGSYYGGIQVRELSEDGFTSDLATAVQVTIPNRFEGAEIVFKDGYYYLFVSATNCCNGPLTGYTVFTGRSASPTGPFVDSEGTSLLAGRTGGTIVLSMNGNRWVGPGHNTVFEDFDGQWWTIYHAIDRNDPYFEGAPGFTRRPAMLDGIDWIDGWPAVRGGRWISDTPQPAPAAQPGDDTRYHTKLARVDEPGRLIEELSDEFNGPALSPQWSWVREPAAGTFGLENGMFRFDTQAADLFADTDNAGVLLEAAPHGNYVVETRVTLDLPPEGCCHNFVHAGLIIYGDDDNYIKLNHVSIWETRQTEFAKEVGPVPPGYSRFGNTVVGPPAETTWLRIVKRTRGGEELYTPYTSRDGVHWVRGGTWTHRLGNNARIGLISMGGSGFTAKFDYVRVYRLVPVPVAEIED